MNPFIEISGRKIGIDFDPLVIAEIGINHAGNLTTAKKMVDAAIRAGVEIIKHQTHIVEDEMCSVAKSVIPGHTKEWAAFFGKKSLSATKSQTKKFTHHNQCSRYCYQS